MAPSRLCSLLSTLLLVISAACRGGGGGGQGETEPGPNLLVMVGDDQGVEVGCYGTVALETPRLDRLAAESLRFTGAYAPSGVCTPSRSTLYTGLEPVRNGATGFNAVDAGVRTWDQWLSQAGYRTGLLGKLGAKPISRFHFDWIERTRREDPGARDLAFHVAGFEAFLDGADARPWALVVNFRDAHWPLPEDGAPSTPGAVVKPHDPARVWVPPVLADTPGTREELARFHDALRRLDATVGALLDVLDRRGLASETVVIYTSDNGPPFPGAKTTLYEWGTREVFLVRWPGVVPGGGVEERFVTLADILPTALDLAGVAAPELDGRSLLPLLRGEDVVWRDEVFGSHTGHRKEPSVPARSVRVGRFKYIWNVYPEREFSNLVMDVSVSWRDLSARAEAGDGDARHKVERLRHRPPEEFYDLEADPWELENLAERPDLAQHKQDLRERLRRHLERQGDPLLERWPF